MNETNPASIESILDHVISEYKQVTTCPAGRFISGPLTDPKTGMPFVKMHALPGFDHGCPRNFNDFLVGCNNMSPRMAFPWYVRSRIRYSCSFLSVTFVHCVIPELKRNGIKEVYAAS